MNRTKTGWLLAGVLSLLLWPAFTASQETSWEKYMEAAGKAYQQADYVKAEKLVKAALREAEKFGEQDPRFATSLNNLALLYMEQGKYVEAEPLYQRSLAIWEKALGPQHPDVATSNNNLAELYRTRGNYAQAEPLYKRSLAIREKVLGPEHPNVASSLNNLALLYDNQSKYAEAEPLYRRALFVLTKALGPDHPNVATTLENYAVLLRKMDRDNEAEKMEARAQAIRIVHALKNPKKMKFDQALGWAESGK